MIINFADIASRQKLHIKRKIKLSNAIALFWYQILVD